MVQGTGKRATIGAAVRGIVSALEAAGVCDEIRPRLSPEARRLLDSPPIHVSWIDDRLIDELVYFAECARGRDFVRNIGYAATRDCSGPVVLPLLKVILGACGASPASLFSNLHRLLPLESRGLTASYQQTDSRAGVVELAFSERALPCAIAFWEGVLRFAFDLCKVTGEVGVAEVSPDGTRARVKVKW